MQRILAAALLAPVLYSGCAARTHQMNELRDLGKLMRERKDSLYVQIPDMLIRVRYAPISEQVLLDTVNEPGTEKVFQELSRDNQIVKDKLSGDFDAYLSIISCGRYFGDDPCDLYSPLNRPDELGSAISLEHREAYREIIRDIIKAASRK